MGFSGGSLQGLPQCLSYDSFTRLLCVSFLLNQKWWFLIFIYWKKKETCDQEENRKLLSSSLYLEVMTAELPSVPLA